MRLQSLRPSFPLACLVILLAMLLFAGGSSRADAMGQALVRGTAWALVAAWALFGPRPSIEGIRPVVWLLAAILAIGLLQLAPLPPSLWKALPGRELASEAARVAGMEQPWRSWSLVPGATINAVAALIVPFTVLLCLSGMDAAQRRQLLNWVLVAVLIATLVGLAQFSGSLSGNLLLKDTDLQASGTFSNRNHFALLLVLGCLMAPVWAAFDERRFYLRGMIALGLTLLFLLTILAIGSRAGLGLALPALLLGLLLVRKPLQRALRRASRWLLPALLVSGVAIIGAVVLVSVASDRAMALDRFFSVDVGQDTRTLGRPIVLAMIREYFPAGAGLGGFDPIFRQHEPFDFLRPTYFNHAHNDVLEIVLDAGAAGLLLMAAALSWWGWASFKAWRAEPGADHVLPRLGSAILLFVFISSIFDYPVRTPLIMAVVVIGAVWLADQGQRHERIALTGA